MGNGAGSAAQALRHGVGGGIHARCPPQMALIPVRTREEGGWVCSYAGHIRHCCASGFFSLLGANPAFLVLPSLLPPLLVIATGGMIWKSLVGNPWFQQAKMPQCLVRQREGHWHWESRTSTAQFHQWQCFPWLQEAKVPHTSAKDLSGAPSSESRGPGGERWRRVGGAWQDQKSGTCSTE